MRIDEALSLVRLECPELDRLERFRSHCRTISDVEAAARGALPRPVFDYVAGDADDEVTLRQNTEAYAGWRFQPRTLQDVTTVDLSTDILGRSASASFGLAPTGYTKTISSVGEPAVARGAASAGMPYVLSTMASTSLEDVAAVPPVGRADRWFQLYVWKDRDLTAELIARAAASGIRVLEVAVDTHVSGFRGRDVKNGLTIPPRMTPAALAGIASRPRYWMQMLASPMIEFANVSGSDAGYTIENISQQFDPSLDWSALAWIRSLWDGPLLLKGPVSPEDAVRAQHLGLDGVHLSNHGGRQLDRSVIPLDLIAPVRAAAGEDFAVLVDSGIRHGTDIAVALAHGADAAFIGRPYLYGLAAAGEPGVAHVIDILRSQLTRILQLLGVTGVAELRSHGAELLRYASA
ncbi:alpha-hydroxy acid oxidase [Bacillus subtilis]|nr:alpha-hydroxy acid oxidase [Bacillus subtilis]